MPDYEICYIHRDGTLACTLSAKCRNDVHAKVLAHAMKFDGCGRFEVWRGRKLVYERPLHFGHATLVEDDLVGAGSSPP